MTSGPPDGVGGIDDRIAERRREVRRARQRSRRRRTFTVLGLLAILAVLVVVERSALVALESVEVVGTERLTEEQVRAAADLEPGTSTVRLRLGRVEERVAALPLVGEVEARRVDPLTVRIAVTERRPVLVARGGGERVLVDRTGQVIDTGGQDGLPVVRLPDPPPDPGARPPARSPLGQAVAAWRGLSGPLRTEVTTYRPTEEGLDLQLRSGVTVRFGRAERVDEKVRALGAVLEDVGETPISAIDVRAPARPAVVP